MTSRYIASDRLSASWTLARAWLDSLAVAYTTIPLSQATIDELEFDLVRAGVPTQVSIRRLWKRPFDIPLRATNDMYAGYMDYETVCLLIDEWTAAMEELEEGTVEFATPILEFASAFPQYAAEAAEAGTPPPDIIAWWAFN